MYAGVHILINTVEEWSCVGVSSQELQVYIVVYTYIPKVFECVRDASCKCAEFRVLIMRTINPVDACRISPWGCETRARDLCEHLRIQHSLDPCCLLSACATFCSSVRDQ